MLIKKLHKNHLSFYKKLRKIISCSLKKIIQNLASYTLQKPRYSLSFLKIILKQGNYFQNLLKLIKNTSLLILIYTLSIL